MNRIEKLTEIRQKLTTGKISVGSWIQIPSPSFAEILGDSGYEWVAVDMEHGSITHAQLPDLFRALELGGTLPLARLAEGTSKDCKMALDAGAGGVIVPMIESAEQLRAVKSACSWPPAGIRGVGFSRANLFGKYFDAYKQEAQHPLLIAMIENISAVENLGDILSVDGLDAILIGPYDLSASMKKIGQFDSTAFVEAMERINALCKQFHIPSGIHVVSPDVSELKKRISEGYQFLAYSMDSVFFRETAKKPVV